MVEWEDEGVELLPVRLRLPPHSGARSRGSPSSLHSAAKLEATPGARSSRPRNQPSPHPRPHLPLRSLPIMSRPMNDDEVLSEMKKMVRSAASEDWGQGDELMTAYTQPAPAGRLYQARGNGEGSGDSGQSGRGVCHREGAASAARRWKSKI